MATVTGTRRLLDISGNNISTAVSLEAEGTLLDSNGQSGTSNQVLISTATGVDWVDGSGSSIIGGPYLPLIGGTLSGNLTIAHTTNPYLYLNDTNAGAGIFQQEGNTTRIGSDTNTQVVLVQNNATAVTINTSKNVGIGTTSPNYKLASYSTTAEGNGTDEFPIVAGKANAIGNFTGIGLASYIAANGAVKAGIALERVGSYGTGKLHFLNNDTLDNSDATLSDSKMTILRNGNVGIGTSSPGQELHVDGNARVTGAYYDSNNSPGTANQVLVSTATGTDWVDGSGSGIIGGPYVPLSGGSSTGQAMTGTLYGPGASFSVSGNNSTNLKVGDGSYRLEMGRTSIQARVTGSSGAAAPLSLNPSGGDVKFTGSGKVGIGVTSPAAKLHVVAPNGTNVGSGNFNFILDAQDVNSVDSNGLLVKGGADSSAGTTFAVQDYSGNTDFMVDGGGDATFAGNVTIGSVDTSVGEGLNIGNASPTIQLFDTTNDAKMLLYTQDSSSIIGTYSNHPLNLFTNSTLALTLDISQNATFAGDVSINGSHLKVLNHTGAYEGQGTDYLYIGGSGLDGSDGAIYLGNGGDDTGYGWRFFYEGSGSGNLNRLIIKSENAGSGVDALAFTQNGNASFGNNVEVDGTLGSQGTLSVGNGQISLSGTGRIQGVDTVTDGTDAANKTYVDNAVSGVPIGDYLPLAGGTMSGDIQMSANNLKFDESGTRSWNIGASSGNLNITSGDSAGSVAIGTGLSVQDNSSFAGSVGIGTTNPTADLHIQGATATDVPLLRVGGFGNSGSKLELAETLTSGDMNYGFSFFNDGNGSNTLIIKAHQNSTAGTTAITINRTNALTTFSTAPVVGTRAVGDNTTRAASTAFVTAAIAAAPQGDITGVTAGTGMTGGGNSGSVTLNVIGGDGITANADDIEVDSTVVRTLGNQTINGQKVFNDDVNVESLVVNSTSEFQDVATFEDNVLLYEGNKLILDGDGDSFANIFYDVNGTGKMIYNSVDEHHFKNGDDGQYDIVKASSFVKDSGTSSQFLKADGTTDSNTYLTTETGARMVQFNRSGINSSTYTMLASVNGNNLASILKMTMTGTSSGVVFACTFDITVNHSQDIHIKSSNGDYTEVTLRITSNNNEDFSIEAKHNGGTTTTAEVCIYPLADEIITPTTTDPGYTGAEYVHTATEGWRYGGEDNNVESSNVIVDGKIGIGTTSPQAALHVAGAFNTAAPTGNGVLMGLYSSSYGYIQLNGPSGGYIDFSTSGTDHKGRLLYDNTSNYMRFDTNGSERIRIDSAGNVGIGTTSPNYPLVVNGVSASNRFYVPNATATTAWVLQARNSANTADSGLYFENGDANLLLRDDSNNLNVRINADSNSYINRGNLGIGTTSPDATLTILRNSSNYAVNRTDVESRSGLSVKSSSAYDSKLNFATGLNSQQYIQGLNNAATTGRPIVLNPYGGYVGINTANVPTQRLDIISGTNNGIRISATDDQTWRDIGIRSYVTEGQANALADHTFIYTTNPSSGTEDPFGKYGATVIQGRDNGNSGFAIRLGNGGGHATRMWMGGTGATTFSNTVTATNFILSSDERLKENIEEVCDNRVKADWKTFELKTEKGQKRYGVIAQELEKTNPEFVREDSQGFKSVAYIDLLIAKIAELEARLEKLEK